VRRRVLTVGRLHQELMGDPGREQIDASRYLRRVCDDLASCLTLDESAGVRIQLDAALGEFASDVAMTLGLIVSELATNAAKHARTGSGVNINVRLAQDLGVWRLTVADDGPGFRPAPDRHRGAGTGLGLVRLLSQKLKGAVAIDDVPSGASISVFFV
jgi:two-component sensor histidine kinase